MKNQALISSKDKSKKLKCRLLQFLFGTLRVKCPDKLNPTELLLLNESIYLKHCDRIFPYSDP